jgi:hypothetical protein
MIVTFFTFYFVCYIFFFGGDNYFVTENGYVCF